jgi:hypothetical protein
MGCLVDTFIITPKPQWRDIASLTDIHKMLPYIPQSYHRLLSALLQEFESLNTIMDNKDKERAFEVFFMAREFEKDGICFSDRRRGPCLQQILRKTFYDTLLIIENDYNPYKYDLFIVVMSQEIITELKWEKSIKHASFTGRFSNNGKILNFRAKQA